MAESGIHVIETTDTLRIWEIIYFCAKTNKNVIFVALPYLLIQQILIKHLLIQGHETSQNS